MHNLEKKTEDFGSRLIARIYSGEKSTP